MVSLPPEIRYFIPCWKEPTLTGQGPSAHEILYAVHPKEGHGYPIWRSCLPLPTQIPVGAAATAARVA